MIKATLMKQFSCIFILILLLAGNRNVKAQASDTVCAFTHRKVYKVVPTPGSKYYWTVDCGKIISGNTHADSIVVDWCNTPGTYQVKVIEQTRFGCWGDTVRTWIIVNDKIHLNLQGPSDICEGEAV